MSKVDEVGDETNERRTLLGALKPSEGSGGWLARAAET